MHQKFTSDKNREGSGPPTEDADHRAGAVPYDLEMFDRPFRLVADARGKELRLQLHFVDDDDTDHSSVSNEITSGSNVQQEKGAVHTTVGRRAGPTINGEVPLTRAMDVASFRLQPGMSGHFVVGIRGMTGSELRRFLRDTASLSSAFSSSSFSSPALDATGAAENSNHHRSSDSLWRRSPDVFDRTPPIHTRASFVPLRPTAAADSGGEFRRVDPLGVKPQPSLPLHFVDPRKFALWTPLQTGIIGWDSRRSPDPYTEHAAWVAHVDRAVGASVSGIRPSEDDEGEEGGAETKMRLPPRIPKGIRIAELMLDQRLFNGVGNYVRAEAMHRAGIDPRSNAIKLLWNRGEDHGRQLQHEEGPGSSSSSPKTASMPPIRHLSRKGQRLLRAVRAVFAEAVSGQFAHGDIESSAELVGAQRNVISLVKDMQNEATTTNAVSKEGGVLSRDVETKYASNALGRENREGRQHREESEGDEEPQEESGTPAGLTAQHHVSHYPFMKESELDTPGQGKQHNVNNKNNKNQFESWLRVYGKQTSPGVCKYKDKGGRTVWYHETQLQPDDDGDESDHLCNDDNEDEEEANPFHETTQQQIHDALTLQDISISISSKNIMRETPHNMQTDKDKEISRDFHCATVACASSSLPLSLYPRRGASFASTSCASFSDSNNHICISSSTGVTVLVSGVIGVTSVMLLSFATVFSTATVRMTVEKYFVQKKKKGNKRLN